MERLNKSLSGKKERPIKVVQFGEGNFLRAFVDYMIDIANEKGFFDGDIVLVKPIEFGSLDMFHEQDCQYTVSLRGIVDGEAKVLNRVVTSVADAVDAYGEYEKYNDLAKIDTLRFVVSNTTEAGIVYDPTDKFELNPPKTFPGKLTKFLYTRFETFHGDMSKGLVMLPVELIDDNGIMLKKCVMQLIDLWGLSEEFKNIKSVVMNINPKNTNVILGSENITLMGSDTIKDTMCGNVTELSPMSFYQVNTEQAENLYGCAKEYACLDGNETVLDLYCGAGTIGLSLAKDVKRVIGCEIVPEAIENARINARVNGHGNAEFFCGDAGEFAAKLAGDGVKPDAAVIDPPRKGCDSLTLDSLVKMSPSRIVMISCNPATAARDAKYLCERGYALEKVRAFDLFGRTGHVECVALMTKQTEDV